MYFAVNKYIAHGIGIACGYDIAQNTLCSYGYVYMFVQTG